MSDGPVFVRAHLLTKWPKIAPENLPYKIKLSSVLTKQNFFLLRYFVDKWIFLCVNFGPSRTSGIKMRGMTYLREEIEN